MQRYIRERKEFDGPTATAICLLESFLLFIWLIQSYGNHLCFYTTDFNCLKPSSRSRETVQMLVDMSLKKSMEMSTLRFAPGRRQRRARSSPPGSVDDRSDKAGSLISAGSPAGLQRPEPSHLPLKCLRARPGGGAALVTHTERCFPARPSPRPPTLPASPGPCKRCCTLWPPVAAARDMRGSEKTHYFHSCPRAIFLLKPHLSDPPLRKQPELRRCFLNKPQVKYLGRFAIFF